MADENRWRGDWQSRRDWQGRDWQGRDWQGRDWQGRDQDRDRFGGGQYGQQSGQGRYGQGWSGQDDYGYGRDDDRQAGGYGLGGYGVGREYRGDDYGRDYGGGSDRDQGYGRNYGRRSFSPRGYQGGYQGGGQGDRDYGSYGDHYTPGGAAGATYGAGYGMGYGVGAGAPYYGGGSYGGQSRRGYGGGGRDRDDRGFWDKTTDEVQAWFGDDDARRRREMDHMRDEREDHRGRGPKNYVRSDDRLREEVSDRLSDDPVVDASEIEVRVSDGEVTLEGTVDNRRARRRAEDCAESVSGVKHVQNNVRVRETTQSAGTEANASATTTGTTGTTGARRQTTQNAT